MSVWLYCYNMIYIYNIDGLFIAYPATYCWISLSNIVAKPTVGNREQRELDNEITYFQLQAKL